MSTLVYQGGLRAPIENEPLVREHLRRANTYRNFLVWVEQGRRLALRDAEETAFGHIGVLKERLAIVEQRVDAAWAAIQQSKMKARSRAVLIPRLVEAHEEAKIERRELRAELSQAGKAARADASVRLRRAEIDEFALEVTKNGRAHCGVGWGTYQLVEISHAQSCKTTPMWEDPWFRRFTGAGCVSAQPQRNADGGLGVGMDSLETHNFVRIEPGITIKGGPDKPNPERAERYKVLAIRLGSAGPGGRTPVWGRWPMILDRPLPKGMRIKRATATLRREGPAERWTYELTLDTSKCERAEECGNGRVAVDIGWRVIDDQVRCAWWQDQNGEQSELRITAHMVSQRERVQSTRKFRDDNFNIVKDVLVAWLMGRGAPGWLKKATSARLGETDKDKQPMTLARWHSCQRLAGVVHLWRDNRFGGDQEMFETLEAWRRQDKLLWHKERALEAKALANRKNYYRLFAAWLARRYSTLVLEHFDLTDVATRESVEKSKAPAQQADAANAKRVQAATSELRMCLVQAFIARGGRVERHDATNTTQDCHACGVTQHFNAWEKIRHRCVNPACGVEWDQDANATSNLLQRTPLPDGHEDLQDGKAPPREGRWARVKREKKEREDAERAKGEPLPVEEVDPELADLAAGDDEEE